MNDEKKNVNNFTEAITEAIEALKNACAKNTSWRNCNICPFEEYCDAIQKDGLPTPDLWSKDE